MVHDDVLIARRFLGFPILRIYPANISDTINTANIISDTYNSMAFHSSHFATRGHLCNS